MQQSLRSSRKADRSHRHCPKASRRRTQPRIEALPIPIKTDHLRGFISIQGQFKSNDHDILAISGIEVLGIVGNIVQVADLGARIALKLCTLCHKIKQAESNIQNLSKDISLTCSVLRQLGDSLQQDEQARLYSQDAFRTAHDILQECDRVFREIESAINNKDSGSYAADARAAEMKNPFVKLTRKVNLAFMEPQLGILQTNLDRLKNTMLLMLNVIIYAGQLRKREAENEKHDQQEMIRLLARQKSDSDRKFERLSKRLEAFQVYENSDSPRDTFYMSPGEETLTARSSPSMSSNSVSSLSAQPRPKAPVVQHNAMSEDQSHQINQEVIKYSELMRAMLESIQSAATVLAPVRHERIRQSVLHMHRQECQNFCDEHGLEAGQLCGLLCNGPLFQSLSSEDPLSVRLLPTRGEPLKGRMETQHRATGIPTRGYAGRAGYAHGHGSVFNVNDLLLKWTTLTADELS